MGLELNSTVFFIRKKVSMFIQKLKHVKRESCFHLYVVLTVITILICTERDLAIHSTRTKTTTQTSTNHNKFVWPALVQQKKPYM